MLRLNNLRYFNFTSIRCLSTHQYKNLRVEQKENIAILTLDQPDSKVNTLNEDLQGEMELAMKDINADSSIKATVIASAKKDSFIAGADINMLASCTTAEQLSKLSSDGQQLFKTLLSEAKPTVAAINGTCLGGGLELALACTYRVAANAPATGLGLPEVMLGLLPGAGGTQRLPKLAGITQALPLLLTGKTLKADKAKKLGIVDSLADPFALQHAAILAASQLADGSLKPKRGPKGRIPQFMEWFLTKTPIGRKIVFDKARQTVQKQTKGKYPAPFAILKCVEAGLTSESEGYKTESQEFGKLGMTPESKALISIFHGQTSLKKNKWQSSDQKKVNKVGIVGAGLMGAGIATVSANKGLKVLLKEINQNGIDRGVAQISGVFQGKVKRRQMNSFAAAQLVSNVTPIVAPPGGDPLWEQHYKHADLVIEAVFEDLSLKHKIIAELESVVPADCVVATNTSALPIEDVAQGAKRPEKIIGMHYFSPVDKMPLLEIIPHKGTDQSTIATAFQVGSRQGKTCIVVKDVPGFYVNRCLGPYMAEAMALLLSGVTPKELDDAMTDFGFPVGPIALADEVGLDVASHVNSFLSQHLGERMNGAENARKFLDAMVQANMKGRKDGKGFYLYGDSAGDKKKKGKKNKKKSGGGKEVNPEMQKILATFSSSAGDKSDKSYIQMRMLSRFLNEAALCVQDGIVASPVDGDIGAVFGIGFPPFLGGPFRFIDKRGADTLVNFMTEEAKKSGPQFNPCDLLKDYAKSGAKFHQ